MVAAMTAPMLVGALVLCAAGLMKLRAPAGAARAARTLGLPANHVLVALFAGAELALGAACAIDPIPALAATVAGTYAIFAVLAAMLARQQSACGCFGENDVPASIAQSILSGVLAVGAAAAAFSGAHGLQWVLDRPVLEAVAILLGIGGAVYATVLAYTEVPRAWSAWSVQ